MNHVVTVVEQFWHKVPGGTAHATLKTLGAISDLNKFRLSGVAAAHDTVEPKLDGLVSMHHSKLSRPLLYEAWLRLKRPTVQSLVGGHDVVWAAAMVVPPTSAPVVTTVHDLEFLSDNTHNSRRGKYFFPLAWRKAKDRSARIVCPSKVVADDCIARGVEPSKVSVVPWGVEPPQPLPDDWSERLSALGLPKRFVLWVGTLEPRKNLRGLVDAFRELESVELVLVGPDGWNVDTADVVAPIANRVHRLGWVDESTLNLLYRKASAFVLPSFAEGFGLPVLEAMARGVPVVTSATTATAEVAGEAALLVDPADSGQIARAVERCLEDEQLAEDLKSKGLRRAAELSWQETAKGYSQIFAEVGSVN